MTRFSFHTRHFYCAPIVIILLAAVSQAQLPQSRLHAVFPPGGQSGQAVEVTVLAGEDLDEADRLLFSHPGITCEAKAEAPASAIGTAYKVHIAPDVPPGLYEMQVTGRFGASNPRRFQVGPKPTLQESEGNNTTAEADELPVDQLLYGRSNGSADVDWFKVELKAGQTVVFECHTERLDSRIVALLEVFDATGRKRLATVRSLPGREPVLPFQVPSDGQYFLKLHDTTYRGGNEFVYGLTVHAAPFLEYALPTAVIAGSTTSVTLFGYNLPGGTAIAGQPEGAPVLQQLDVDVTPPAEPVLNVEAKLSPAEAAIDAFSYRLPASLGGSNPIRLAITESQLAIDLEQPDDAPQQVTLPVDISGQFAKVGDTDRFRFTAKQGDAISIDVLGQRMGGYVDPLLIVEQIQTNAEGQETVTRVAALDDDKTSALPNVFETASSDPSYRLKVPADGTYQVTLRDRYWETRGNMQLAYRCRIRFERPEFRLVALPAAPTAGQVWPVGLRRGDNFSVHVLAFKQDGFDSPIDVTAVGLPAGVTSIGAMIGPGQTSSMLTFQVSSDAPVGWFPIQLQGTARIDDPTSVAASAAARKQLADLEAPAASLQTRLAAIGEKLKDTQAAFAQVTTAVQGVQLDEAVKKELEAAAAQVIASLTKAQEQTKAELAAATEKVSAARSALDQAVAHQQSSARVLQQQARIGTVIWNSATNVPAISRVSTELGLSIIEEPAPFQVKHNLRRIEVRPGRQLVLTAQVERRNGFEEVVKLDVQGLPKEANIDFEKGDVAKERADKQLRIFVKDNAPADRVFTAWLASEGEVNYRRNPERAERLKQTHAAAQQKLTDQKAKTEQAAQAKAELDSALKQSQEQLKAAQAAQAERQQRHEAAQKDLQQAEAELARLQTLTSRAESLMAASKSVANQYSKIVMETAPTLAAATTSLEAAGQLLQGNPDSAELKQRVDSAKKLFDATNKVVEELRQQATAASAELVIVEQQGKMYADQFAQAKKMTAERQAAVASAKASLAESLAAVQMLTAAGESLRKQVADAVAVEQAAAAELKAAEQAEQAAGKAAADAAKAAEPQKKKFTPPSEPVIFVVKPAPVGVKVETPNGGAIKQGDKLELKVTIERKPGFAGPVRVALGDVAAERGVAAQEVSIPADANEARLIVAANPQALEGDVPLAVVRTISEFDGEAIVDAPVSLKVAK